MILIAHRGNYAGRNKDRENSLSYINEALAAGYDVEVDVWFHDSRWYLGHDVPMNKIHISFLERPQIWVHAKNLEGYKKLYPNPNIHVFWHDKDDFTFTSKGIKWANAGVKTHDGIVVMPELSLEITTALKLKELKPLGVCSDNFSLFD